MKSSHHIPNWYGSLLWILDGLNDVLEFVVSNGRVLPDRLGYSKKSRLVSLLGLSYWLEGRSSRDVVVLDGPLSPVAIS